jgi:hypothetical protein
MGVVEPDRTGCQGQRVGVMERARNVRVPGNWDISGCLLRTIIADAGKKSSLVAVEVVGNVEVGVPAFRVFLIRDGTPQKNVLH